MVREYMGAVCFAQLRGFRPDYYSYFSNFVTAKKLATLLSPSRNIFQMLFQRPRKSRLSPTCILAHNNVDKHRYTATSDIKTFVSSD